MTSLNSISDDVKLGQNVRLARFINLYGCEIGDETKIGAFVEVQKNASIGKCCKISSHSFICEGVAIEDNVFIGHGVTFTNDTYPRATLPNGTLQTDGDWKVERIVVKKGASIGSGATILPNLTIGESAIVGAGSVVTRDVPPFAVVAGNPARIMRFLKSADGKDEQSPIPFLDLVTPHLDLERELLNSFREALHTAGFVGGPAVQRFEGAFAKLCHTQHAIGISNGTDALHFAIRACGVEPDDVVVTVPNTFIATTEAIAQARAVPEFVDIDERTYNMSPLMLRRYLETQCARDKTGKVISLRSGRPVTAVIPVHLYGQMADMDQILALADEYGLMVIEDACQAHGAEYYSQKLGRWVRAGSMGRAAAFSFYPGKNLGACGEAGAVTTNDDAIASKIKMLRDHGQVKKYYHEIEGYNGRLDAIQAGILHTKLGHLDKWNSRRRELAGNYDRLLAKNESLGLPFEPSWSRAVYHLYVVRTADRDGLIEHLKQAQIGTGIHYPIPLHLQNACVSLGYGNGDFPASERVAKEVVSLPMFPQLTESQQARVVEELIAFTSKSTSTQMKIEETPMVAVEPL